MTQVTISDTTQTVTVQEAVYQVQIASAAADTQVNSGGTGTSLIQSSTGGITTLKSVTGGDNVTLTDDGNGNITISAVEDDFSNNTTDNLSEGSSNQYFTDARVMTALETVSGHIIPSANVTYDLGSTTSMWRDVYVGPGSLFINGQKILSSQTGQIDITTDAGENLNVQAGGSITMLSSNGVTTIQDATVNLGPSVAGGTVALRGNDISGIRNTTASKYIVGTQENTGNKIEKTSGNLEIKTPASGEIVVNTGDFYVGNGDTASDEFIKIDENTISKVNGGSLTVTGNLVGNVTGQVSDLSNKSTSDLSEGSNLYYTDARADARAQLKVDALVDSAPGALDTLNELAAALGDDANFSTTVTNSIATKLASADFNSTFDTRLATKDTDNISEGSSNLYYTDARFNTAFGNKSTSDLSEGTNQYFTTARARASISASGSLAYNSSTGALTYTQGNTDTVAEGSSNLYYTDARADARVNNAILDEDNFASDSATKVPSQQSVKAYIATQIATKDNTDEITEGSSNLYFTNERVDDRVNALLQAGSNISLTYDDASNTLTISSTDTEDNLSNNDTDDLSEGSSNLYHTSARAISAVEGESTLALTGQVTMSQDLDVSGIIKVDDGFTLQAFNPYGAGSNMPTSIMGVGQEDGWAGVHVRNRGAHDFGIGSQFNFSPRAIMVMSAGRKSGSNDDYLDSGDEFGVLSFNPYSGYKTGAEWLTGSAEISAIATENHSTTGLGTKIRIGTTENGEEAGATESSHVNKTIDIQGTTITTSDTLKIDDDLIVTGSITNDGGDVTVADTFKATGANSNLTTIGDQTITSNNYAIHGLKVQADDTKWGAVLIKEFVGGANKPALSGFSNPTFGTEIVGGTPSSPSAVGSGKRTFVLQSIAANESDGTLPGVAGAMLKFETTESQTTSAMGHKVAIESIANGATTRSSSIIAQGGSITLHAEGDAEIYTGGDLNINDDVKITGTLNQQGAISNSTGDVTINDNLKVNNNLTVDGNTQLGNANTDTATATAKLIAQNGFNNTVLNTATANAILGMGIVSAGDQAYISDGNAGSPCMAFSDGSNWKKMHSPGDNISSS